ncbi:MAG: gamma carbonic anhydrase family protein [Balneolaceae bacterium]
MIYTFLDHSPVYDDSVFVAPSADLIGNVTIGSESSVWFQAVLRGDVHHIRVGEQTNIQDQCMIHVTHRTCPTRIGNQVTVGHSAVLHGCTIHDRVLVGIRSVVLDRAVIEPDVMLAAGSLVPPGKILESGNLYMGSPAWAVRKLTIEEVGAIREHAERYVTYARAYQQKDTYDSNPFYDAES